MTPARGAFGKRDVRGAPPLGHPNGSPPRSAFVGFGLQTDRTAQIVIAGHAFVQNLRRSHYDLALDTPPATRLAAAFTELAQAI